jgi:hypothetical protein
MAARDTLDTPPALLSPRDGAGALGPSLDRGAEPALTPAFSVAHPLRARRLQPHSGGAWVGAHLGRSCGRAVEAKTSPTMARNMDTGARPRALTADELSRRRR